MYRSVLDSRPNYHFATGKHVCGIFLGHNHFDKRVYLQYANFEVTKER